MSRDCRMRFERFGSDGNARRGRLHFPRGTVETPAFMPVGTYGTVKGMLPRDIHEIGAEIILGNAKDDMGGNFFGPTIVIGVTQDMKVAKEETFGPMAPLFKFENEDDVIAMANDTIFGLAAYFYAKDLSRVYKVAEALEYGIIGVNTGIISTEVAPFGGVKQSGLGREGSHHGMDEYLELKYICMSV